MKKFLVQHEQNSINGGRARVDITQLKIIFYIWKRVGTDGEILQFGRLFTTFRNDQEVRHCGSAKVRQN